ncbi:MAG: filamentous hemagglutinin N-terminal domain-containing protein [Cyanobacteria bacterium P01_A01_bin.114]
MSKRTRQRLWQSIWLSTGLLTLAEGMSSGGASGQVLPDQTLGGEASVVMPNATVRGLSADQISGGAVRGDALFHSFEAFGITADQRVYFSNPAGIDHILSRVTGSLPSDIDGTLGVDGAANLYLINPNGIVFGPNAQLDVAGSFTASTADRLTLGEAGEFRATNPNLPPLVAVNIPIGLQFGATPPAALVNEATLTTSQNLTLSAGEVISAGHLSAPQGQVRLEGVAGNVRAQSVEAQSAELSASEDLILEDSQLRTTGDLSLLAGDTVRIRDSVDESFVAIATGDLTIQGNNSIDILALNHPETPFQSGGALTLISDGPISGDAHFASGGDFAIRDRAGNPGSFVSLYDPIISVNGDVTLGSYDGVSLLVEATGSIEATRGITITGPDDTIPPGPPGSDREILRTTPALILRSGVTLQELENSANDGNLPFDEEGGESGIFVFNEPEGALSNGISVGNINGEDLFEGEGNLPVRIILEANRGGSVSVNGQVDSHGEDIDITGTNVNINNSVLSSDAGDTFQDDLSGDINIAANSVTVDNSTVSASFTSRFQDGTAGRVSLDADSVIIQNDSTVSANFSAGADTASTIEGTAGEVSIAATTVTLDASTLEADVFEFGPQPFSSPTQLTANGGRVAVIAADEVILRNDSRVSSSARETSSSVGDNLTAGSIQVTANRLTVQDGSEIVLSNRQGPAGTVNLSADVIDLNNGTISSEVGQIAGSGTGDINLAATSLLTMQNESLIAATGFNGATGGDISLANVAFAFGDTPTGQDGSDIIVRGDLETEGDRGTILVDPNNTFGFQFQTAVPGNRTNDIETEVERTDDVPGTDLPPAPHEFEPLPADFTAQFDPVRRQCDTAVPEDKIPNGVTVVGRGGLPDAPTDLLEASPAYSDWVRPRVQPGPEASTTWSDGSSAAAVPERPIPERLGYQAFCRQVWSGSSG